MSEPLSQLERFVRQFKHELKLEAAEANKSKDKCQHDTGKHYYRGRHEFCQYVLQHVVDDIAEHIERTTKK